MKSPGTRLKSLATHNAGLKLLAIFLATASWYGIRRTIGFEVTTPNVRLEIVPPAGFAVQHQSESAVDVTFRGSQEDIRFLDVKSLAVTVEIAPLTEAGSYDYALMPANVSGARGVRPIRIHPGRVRVEIDREVEKQVPVRVRTTGVPMSGRLDDATGTPSKVTLHGPARKLQIIDHLSTTPIDLSGRIESFTRRVAVAQPGDDWVARITPPEIVAEIVISDTPAEREWPAQKVLALLPPESRRQVSVTPPRVNVIVSGRAQALDRLADTIPTVSVDCTALQPNIEYDLPVTVFFPGTDAAFRAEPPYVRVEVREF